MGAAKSIALFSTTTAVTNGTTGHRSLIELIKMTITTTAAAATISLSSNNTESFLGAAVWEFLGYKGPE